VVERGEVGVERSKKEEIKSKETRIERIEREL